MTIEERDGWAFRILVSFDLWPSGFVIAHRLAAEVRHLLELGQRVLPPIAGVGRCFGGLRPGRENVWAA